MSDGIVIFSEEVSKHTEDAIFIRGMGLAFSEALSYGAGITSIKFAMTNAGLDRQKFKDAGLEEFDMNKLEPVSMLIEESKKLSRVSDGNSLPANNQAAAARRKGNR